VAAWRRPAGGRVESSLLGNKAQMLATGSVDSEHRGVTDAEPLVRDAESGRAPTTRDRASQLDPSQAIKRVVTRPSHASRLGT